MGDVVTAAAELRGRGVGEVLVSLGGAGALLVGDDGVVWGGGEPLVPLSTVGAGDCTLAGFLHACGSPADRPRDGRGLGPRRRPPPGQFRAGRLETTRAATAVRT